MSELSADQGLLLHCSELKYHSFGAVIQETLNSLDHNYGVQFLPTLWNQVGSLDRGNFRILNDMNPPFLSILIDGQFKLADPRSTSTWQTTIPILRSYPNLRNTPILGMCCSNISYYHDNDRRSELAQMVEAPRSVVEAAQRLNLLQSLSKLVP